jgi:site-specific recombinase XerD
MSKPPVKSFAGLLQGFFCQRLQTQRRVSNHTLASYRDTFRLGLEFMRQKTGRIATQQQLIDWDAPNVLAFLDHLEKVRGCQPRTRNQRLAAIRAFMSYVGSQEPTALALSSRVLAIPAKRAKRPLLGFLSKSERDAVLAAVPANTANGRRDRLLFGLLYHTGARISEILALKRQDIQWGPLTTIQIQGKGRKQRAVPLLKPVATDLKRYLADFPGETAAPLFTNCFGHNLTRFGAAKRLRLAVKRAAEKCGSLKGRSISPHTFRHSTAMHLLQAGVDVCVIALLLGHESPSTTHQYIELDLQMKEQCLHRLESPKTKSPRFKPSDHLLAFLEAL